MPCSLVLRHFQPLRLRNTLNNEVRGSKVCFPWRLQSFGPFEVKLCICLVIAKEFQRAEIEWRVGSVVVEIGVFGAPRFSVQRSQNTCFKVFWDLWTENRGASKAPNSTTTDPTPHSRPSSETGKTDFQSPTLVYMI